ncbi:MAG: flagellin FliC [Myxococcales bacterium]|nr:flagellin FliC [Myxococcales bacterium]
MLDLNTNVAALTAESYLNRTQNNVQGSFQKLSSGMRINSAADDAAGLGIAKSMNAQVQSYTVAQQNAADAINMVQTADGASDQIGALLTRMRVLAVEAQNGTMSANDKANLDTEFQQDMLEIDRVAGDANFNGQNLLAGAGSTVSFQVGIFGTSNDQITVNFGGVDSSGLGLTGTSVTSAGLLNTLDVALQNLSTTRSHFGATINRLQIAQTATQDTQTNLSAALATIQDVNVAAETANLAREQVLAQAGVSVLSQANQSPQLALKLLGG